MKITRGPPDVSPRAGPLPGYRKATTGTSIEPEPPAIRNLALFGLCNAFMLFSFHRRAPFTALSCACAAAWACRHVAGLDCSLSPM
jgi:hypothetical protein